MIGNITDITDPLNFTTSQAFNPLKQLVETTNAMGGVTHIAYGPNGLPVEVVDPRGLVTSMSYDGLGSPAQIQTPDSGATAQIFDPSGNLTQSTDARGISLTYTVDALNRVTKITPSQGQPVSFTYDGNTRRLARMGDPSGVTTWTYDAHGREILKTQEASGIKLAMTTVRDAVGRISTMTYSSGRRVAYQYDSVTGKTSATSIDGTPFITNITYQPFGAAAGWQMANGETYTRSYDQDGRLSQIDTVPNKIVLSRNDAGRITSIGGAAVTALELEYDAAGALLRQMIGGTEERVYAYDENGNPCTMKTGI